LKQYVNYLIILAVKFEVYRIAKSWQDLSDESILGIATALLCPRLLLKEELNMAGVTGRLAITS